MSSSYNSRKHRRDLEAEWSRRTVRQEAEQLANAFLYLSCVSPNHWEHAYRNSNLKYPIDRYQSWKHSPWECFMSNHDLSNFVLQWWVAGLFQRHRVSTKIELIYHGASTRDTGLMGLDPESREMENVYELIPDENSTVRRNYLRTWCAQEEEEFWRSPNVWKVNFFLMNLMHSICDRP